MDNRIDKNHAKKKRIFKVLGLTILLVGIIFTVLGFINFMSAFGTFGEPPKIGYMFIGLPLIFVGSVLTSMGFMGDVMRYQAGEVAPVGKDVINYMVDETQDSIKKVSKAIHEGMSSYVADVVICKKCKEENDGDSKFCNNCGEPLVKTCVCQKCKEVNDFDAKYCNNCGEILHKFNVCPNCKEENDIDAKYCDNCGEKLIK